MAQHLFPNVLPVMMVHISLNMGWAILNAAGLSFIGLGVQPPTPEWGIMVAEGATYIVSGEWWLALFPRAVLMLAVFCFNLLGDGLRDLLELLASVRIPDPETRYNAYPYELSGGLCQQIMIALAPWPARPNY